MSADERTSACEKGHANVIGAISVEERTTAGLNGYVNGLGAIPADERRAVYGQNRKHEWLNIDQEVLYM